MVCSNCATTFEAHNDDITGNLAKANKGSENRDSDSDRKIEQRQRMSRLLLYSLSVELQRNEYKFNR